MNKYLKLLFFFLFLLSSIQPASAHSPGTFVLIVSLILLVAAIIANILKYFLLRRLRNSNSSVSSDKIVKITIIEFVLILISLYTGIGIFPIDHYYALAFGFIIYSILAIFPNLLLFCYNDTKYSDVIIKPRNIIQAFIYGMIYSLLLIFFGFVSESIL